jgi:ABC-type Fe3+-siderophore transport system permease subunit
MNTDKFNPLFSRESLLTLQGAALAAMIIPNVLTYLIGAAFLPYEKWLGFGIAMTIAIYIATRSRDKGTLRWVIAVLNGFLIFSASAGLTDMLGGARPADVSPTSPAGIPFFHSWFQ